ncbi:MAG: Sensor protein ZraS [Candidatus Anoxychlamydiales bacterium]|nr:Sensor protein ZraS [Candidatus Anoxychlamydiales bacterium]
MSDILKKLNETANLALNSASTQESMKHLAKAFSLFSTETTRLENAYQRLLKRFNQVNNQLKIQENELRQKVTDLNSVTSYLNNILTNISQGIIYIDLDGIVTTYNKVAQDILGIDEKKVLFKSFSENFSDRFFGFSMKNALKFSMCQKISYISINKKQIEINTSFIYDCPTPYRGIVLLLKDITKIQNLQISANRNDRLNKLGEIAANIAHEIKNPLGAIRGYASLLYKDLENSKPLQDMILYILDGTKAMERVVTNVLEYARPFSLEVVSLDINELIKEIIKSIKIDLSFSSKIKIHLNLTEPNFYIPADKEHLKSAILNIIINAYHAMEDSGILRISVIKNSNFCIISIEDTGDGIDQKDLENIFSPFFTTKQNGNGLGLSHTNKIIQAHFATLDVTSKLYKGSTFTITMPIKRG